MDLRTGDIIVWRSTNYYDILAESTIMLKGLHSGIVLIGKKLRKLSVGGISPTNTYVSFLVDSLFPIEEIIGHVWHRPNGASLYHIHRTSGRDIPEKEAYRVFKKYLSMKKRPFFDTIYISMAAYFKWGGIAVKTGYDNKRWNLCSILIAYCLNEFRLLSPWTEENNLLPIDFLDLKFYQSENYESICIFDKGTHTIEWFFCGLLINLGQLEVNPMHNPLVDYMLTGYNYPQTVKSPEIKHKANNYLIET